MNWVDTQSTHSYRLAYRVPSYRMDVMRIQQFQRKSLTWRSKACKAAWGSINTVARNRWKEDNVDLISSTLPAYDDALAFHPNNRCRTFASRGSRSLKLSFLEDKGTPTYLIGRSTFVTLRIEDIANCSSVLQFAKKLAPFCPIDAQPCEFLKMIKRVLEICCCHCSRLVFMH